MSVIDPKQTFAACDQGHSAKVFTGLLHRAPIDALSLGADKRRETMLILGVLFLARTAMTF